LSKGNDGDPPLVVLQVKCAKGIQYFKMTLVNELRLFAMHTSVQMFFLSGLFYFVWLSGCRIGKNLGGKSSRLYIKVSMI